MRSVLAALALGLLAATPAPAETCHRSGEETRGLGKVCYYRCSFGETTENIGAAALCPLTTQASAAATLARRPSSGGSCHKSGEREDGMTKQCIYDCTGTTRVVTIGRAQLCPLTTR